MPWVTLGSLLRWFYVAGAELGLFALSLLLHALDLRQQVGATSPVVWGSSPGAASEMPLRGRASAEPLWHLEERNPPHCPGSSLCTLLYAWSGRWVCMVREQRPTAQEDPVEFHESPCGHGDGIRHSPTLDVLAPRLPRAPSESWAGDAAGSLCV